MAECWVVGWLSTSTDEIVVFLFTGNLIVFVISISIFLQSSVITWFRGSLLLLFMSGIMVTFFIWVYSFDEIVTITICMVGGFLFGIFLLHKAFSLVNNSYTHNLQKNDYVIGSLTVYVDFGFVLLLMLFVMLAMIMNFMT
eukprot:CAMPEP_0170543212 /NCGR_PEP_ID=MMETSP0211-20121228/2406_1 /TAXON_ID=311385 /ORGANISM="Pseudokeronopsis sp., Strain OXSARD2" /LENGTH=140 /DNA_ID=CAMNT_0010846535 /DNA_START=703 /DNA_END=1125 /DNA_ORIENTATION=+